MNRFIKPLIAVQALLSLGALLWASADLAFVPVTRGPVILMLVMLVLTWSTSALQARTLASVLRPTDKIRLIYTHIGYTIAVVMALSQIAFHVPH
jgi:hypothetical protein